MGKRFVGLVAAALAAGAIVVGCGDDEKIATAHFAKPAYVEKANLVCDRTYKRIQSGYTAFAEPREGKPIDDAPSVERFAHTVLIPAKEWEIEKLRALGAPTGDEEKIEAILDAYEEGVEIAESNPNAAVSSPYGVFDKATELTQDYGLDRCLY